MTLSSMKKEMEAMPRMMPAMRNVPTKLSTDSADTAAADGAYAGEVQNILRVDNVINKDVAS